MDEAVSQYGVNVFVDPKAIMHIVGTYVRRGKGKGEGGGGGGGV
jgi:hypothetical protein